MTADDTVTAKLAEWEADMDRRVPAADLEDRNIARALLGFVKEVLTLIDEDHCPGGCEHDAIDAEVLGDRIKRALMEQIGGEG